MRKYWIVRRQLWLPPEVEQSEAEEAELANWRKLVWTALAASMLIAFMPVVAVWVTRAGGGNWCIVPLIPASIALLWLIDKVVWSNRPNQQFNIDQLERWDSSAEDLGLELAEA